MSVIQNLFTEHPKSVGETYWQHLRSAASFAGLMLYGSMVCMIHALLPFVFTRTGSDCVASLYQRMVTGRHRDIYDRQGIPRPASDAPSEIAGQTAAGTVTSRDTAAAAATTR